MRPDDLASLDFEAERDAETTSWQRAAPVGALIESTGPETHIVTLPDGADAHHVELVEDHGRFLGYCDGKGFEYNDGPCAHLCTVRQAAFVGLSDLNGRRITIPPLSSVRAGTDSAVATDGGRIEHIEAPPTGHDGHVFGRPEGQL
ncbi:hypothetical protein C440_07552 [Haloferax mucosum ATCC BAA-1512]|uniref:SWIM-type domain-containing protein n=1 Tax=Haloferax mucosum ATCC BAA-1512 TaxID=662479 RepID=M0IGD6_9EURY|nr:hypothetical protein [Haloferax mucosum]ELZ94913.1 hypothetical protein C440_07552 [Haloferax mucosum ATCC BAA-1512]